MYSLKHILIVDDDSVNNIFTQIILEDAGVGQRITVCHCVKEALALLYTAARQPEIDFPDLILLGQDAEHLNNAEFLEHYNSMGYRHRYQTFIFLFRSAAEQSPSTLIYQDDIVAGLISKPLSLVSLNDMLAKARLAEIENKLP